MNWFQQNRLLGMFLIIFGSCAVIAGIVFYVTKSKWNNVKGEFDAAITERNRLERLDPFPSDTNYRKMEELLKSYSAALDKVKDELKTQVLPASPLAPNEFQSRLLQSMMAISQKARANNVKLPKIFYLGFDPFVTSLPNPAAAPLLGQELSQVQTLMNILVDARVDSVTSLQRTPLPEEQGPAPAPSPAPSRGRKAVSAVAAGPKMLERNFVDLTFKAAPLAVRKALNQIASSPAQFYIIRTLYVRNEKDKGPTRITEPNAAAAQAETPAPSSGAPLNFIVGNEHIEVSARIEMVKFTF